MGLEKKKEESKSSHVPSSLPPICMLYSNSSSSSSNKVNKVTFGYHVLIDEVSLYSPAQDILLTPPAIPSHSIPDTSQQFLPSQSARRRAFVAFLISKRALVCSLVHPALTQAKGDEAMKAKAQTKMTFLAKQEVSISKVILIDAAMETAFIYIYI
jgi:hypothetical protein